MSVSYRPPGVADAAALSAMARTAFADTFAAHFPADPLARYLDDAYGPRGVMTRDLADPAVSWRIAEAEAAIIGYAKLTPLYLPTPAPRAGALELKQIYLERGWQGRGIADALLDWTFATARGRGADELYLAVFDWNARACAFYARHGFVQVSAFDFDLGGMAARDTIWRRDL